jgi:hypothetical protein
MRKLALNLTMKRTLRTVAGAALAGALLVGCGQGEDSAASVPQGWGTMDTDRLSVSYPQGFKELGAGERSESDAAAAERMAGGETVGGIYVEFDFSTGVHSADDAAVAAESRVQVGGTPGKTTDVTVAGPDGSVEAKRITYAFTSDGSDGMPAKGTRVSGTMVTGLDSTDKPFLVTVNAKNGLLSESDVKSIVESIELK